MIISFCTSLACDDCETMVCGPWAVAQNGCVLLFYGVRFKVTINWSSCMFVQAPVCVAGFEVGHVHLCRVAGNTV